MQERVINLWMVGIRSGKAREERKWLGLKAVFMKIIIACQV